MYPYPLTLTMASGAWIVVVTLSLRSLWVEESMQKGWVFHPAVLVTMALCRLL